MAMSYQKPVNETVARNAIGGVMGGCAAVAGFAFGWPMLLTAFGGVGVAVLFWFITGLFYGWQRNRGVNC